MNKEIIVNIDDIKKAVYFISNLTQMQGNRPMRGALSTKGDYMGVIFDRWINIIPEGVIFNKIFLPQVNTNKKISVITDYYDYDPKLVGIAPDVIGIEVDGKAIPFVEFNNKWIPIKGMPQIEVKTFKKNQKMVSLRNQNYDNKYLVLAETSFRIDYLIPLMNKDIFSDEVYDELYMNDDIFITNNSQEMVAQPRKVDLSRSDLGSIKLLKITSADNFMKMSIKCEQGVSVEYFTTIEEKRSRRIPNMKEERLSDYCELNINGLYSFNSKWYERIDEDGITYRRNKKMRTLDFYIDKIENVKVLKICKSKMVVEALENCIFGDSCLEKGKVYDIGIDFLDRSGSSGDEYFLLKTAVSKLYDEEENLLEIFNGIISER